MAHISQVNVNGTDYDIVQAGGIMPVICEMGTCESGGIVMDNPDPDVKYTDILDSNIEFVLKRTGESGSYQYFLVGLLRSIPGDAYFAPAKTPEEE